MAALVRRRGSARLSGRLSVVAQVVIVAQVVALGVLVLGCSDRPAEPAPPSASTPRIVVSPGALAEGRIEAFGLQLPASSSLKKRSPSSVSVEVASSFDETLAYLRERVEIGAERRVKKRLFLEDVALRGRPEGPRLRIALRALSSTTEVVVSVEASPTDEPLEDDPTPATSAIPSASAP
jgi:hypothetical protein